MAQANQQLNAIKRGGRIAYSPPRFFCLLLLASCTLFEPRDSENPLDESELTWLPPLSPGAVLSNLEGILQTTDYLRYEEILSDSGWSRSFMHLGDRSNLDNGLATDWGRNEEVLWWQRFSDQSSQTARSPEFILSRRDSVQATDSASYQIDYQIQLPLEPASAGHYSGRLQLSLSRHLERGDWGIHRWEDFGSDTSSSWTLLKQAYIWP